MEFSPDSSEKTARGPEKRISHSRAGPAAKTCNPLFSFYRKILVCATIKDWIFTKITRNTKAADSKAAVRLRPASPIPLISAGLMAKGKRPGGQAPAAFYHRSAIVCLKNPKHRLFLCFQTGLEEGGSAVSGLTIRLAFAHSNHPLVTRTAVSHRTSPRRSTSRAYLPRAPNSPRKPGTSHRGVPPFPAIAGRWNAHRSALPFPAAYPDFPAWGKAADGCR